MKNSTYDRFDLEDAMSNLHQIGEDIEAIIYAIGDSPIKHTEDQLLNMLIGMKQFHDTRYQKMWSVFEQLIKNGVISNKNVKMPPYDDGTMAMEVTNSEGELNDD